MIRYFARRALKLCFASTVVFGLILYSLPNTHVIKSLFDPENMFRLGIDISRYVNSQNDEDHDTLPNHRTLFMVETSGKSQLTARQACAVESAARINSRMTIILYLTNDKIKLKSEHLAPLRLLNNVKITRLDIPNFLADSPFERWYFTNLYESNPLADVHAKEMIRFLLLWKYGGIYLDFNKVVTESLGHLNNHLVRIQDGKITTEIMAFERRDPFLMECMKKFAQKTKKSESVRYNSARVVNELLVNRCSYVNESHEMCGHISMLSLFALNSNPQKKLSLLKKLSTNCKNWTNTR